MSHIFRLMIQLQLIHPAIDRDHAAYHSPEGAAVIADTLAHYARSGYAPPWASYLVLLEGEVVGVGAFVAPPDAGVVEIAYFTFPAYEGRGVATAACRALIDLARTADPTVRLTAKTEPRANASTRVLQKNGFVRAGMVTDHEIGEAWLWSCPPEGRNTPLTPV